MQLIYLKRVMLAAAVAACFLVVSWTGGPVLADPDGGRDLAWVEAALAMDLVYQGKTHAAVEFLDTLSVIDKTLPLYLLIKSRLAREFIPVDNDNKERVKSTSEPVLRDLDRVIALCDEWEKTTGHDEDPELLLYRGMARMSKSHLKSFARNFWSAGRNAKKGKSDLEKYLEIKPGDPVATGAMGVFLYFADTISSLFKYISRLLLMPGGDREMGLEYLRTAAQTESAFQTDYQMAAVTIDLLFEGRYKNGLDGSLELLRRFPHYPRLAIPMALMQPFDPLGVPAGARAIDSTLERIRGDKRTGVETAYPLALLDFLNAYASRFVAPPDVAEHNLNQFTEPDSSRPDWITGYAAFELGRLMASEGRLETAREIFSFVRGSQSAGFMRDEAEKMAKALEKYPVAVSKTYPVTEIYFGTGTERLELLKNRNSIFASSVKGGFYLGETFLLAGRMDEALIAYSETFAADAGPWDDEFKMLSASRAAEICGAKGEYAHAADWLDRAQKYYHKEYLVDWILEGRRRYYKRLEEGEETVTPRLLTPAE
jgi:tetratricopeptide (TPR) repeat protein